MTSRDIKDLRVAIEQLQDVVSGTYANLKPALPMCTSKLRK